MIERTDVVVRPPGFRAVAWCGYALAAFGLLQAVVTAAAFWDSGSFLGNVAWLAAEAISIAFVGWISYRSAKVAVEVKGDRVMVRNLARTHELLAEDIVGVELDRKSRFAVLRCVDGRTQKARAIRWTFSDYRSKPGSSQTVEARLARVCDALQLAPPAMPSWAAPAREER